MTFQAPFHLQRIRLRDDRHLIDTAMTSRTAHALGDMNRVIEICEVRQVVNANPLERLARLETCAYRFEIGTVSPNLFVAIHAHRRRRHSGGCRSLNRRMTVTAIDAVIADVMLMTKLNWLLALDVCARVPAGSRDLGRDPKRGKQNKNRAKDRGSREIVGAVSENLWHRRRYNLLTLAGGLIHRCCTQAGAQSTNATSKN